MRYTSTEAANALNNSEDEAFLAARHIRTRFTFEEQSSVLDRLGEDSPFIKRFLIGVTFAANPSELWARPSTVTISSSQKALDWFILTCKRYASKLKKHVEIRDRVNNAALHGDWEGAAKCLDEHQALFGPTFWAINWTLLLIDEQRGAELKAKYINEFENIDETGGIHILAVFLGLSTDQALPEETFRRTAFNFARNSKAKRFLELFLLEEFSTNWTISEVLEFFDFVPLVDRYEFFIRLTLVNPNGQFLEIGHGQLLDGLLDFFNLTHTGNIIRLQRPRQTRSKQNGACS